MTTDVIFDRSTTYGERVHRRLDDEQVIWLTTPAGPKSAFTRREWAACPAQIKTGALSR